MKFIYIVYYTNLTYKEVKNIFSNKEAAMDYIYTNNNKSYNKININNIKFPFNVGNYIIEEFTMFDNVNEEESDEYKKIKALKKLSAEERELLGLSK